MKILNLNLKIPRIITVHIIETSLPEGYYYYWQIKLENCEVLGKRVYKSKKSVERSWFRFCDKQGIEKSCRFVYEV